MKLHINIISLLLVCMLGLNISFAQQQTTDGMGSAEEIVDPSQEESDAEALIIEPENENAYNDVDYISEFTDIVADLEQSDDSPFVHFAIYSNNPSVVDYDESEQSAISEKFDAVKITDESYNNFLFIRQTLYNENRQAWDYIYERVYNAEGRLMLFVRRYNTYNSECAEVAFERSEYYYNNHGQLIKKTYQIFDSNNNALDPDNCWMDRETYNQYKTYYEFKEHYPLSL